jgi:hypothetical protein
MSEDEKKNEEKIIIRVKGPIVVTSPDPRVEIRREAEAK